MVPATILVHVLPPHFPAGQRLYTINRFQNRATARSSAGTDEAGRADDEEFLHEISKERLLAARRFSTRNSGLPGIHDIGIPGQVIIDLPFQIETPPCAVDRIP